MAVRTIYLAMVAAAELQARWEVETTRAILRDRRRLLLLALLALPVVAPAVASAAAPLPEFIGGKSRFGPSFFTLSTFYGSIAIGVFAGLITGCTGAGGGFVVTPALMSIGIKGILAVGTDMFHIFAKAIMGTTVHRKLGNVNVALAAAFVVGSTAGVTAGGMLNRALFEYNPVVSDFVISSAYVLILGFLGFYSLADFLHSRNAKLAGGERGDQVGLTALARRLQSVKLPPTIRFDEEIAPGGRSISALFVTFCGLAVGFVASILGAGGGFLTFPMFVYGLGVSTFTTVGSNTLQIIFTAGYGAIAEYALYGYVFYTLAMGMLLGSLLGVQLGALATKCVRGVYIRAFYAVAILAGFVNRLFALPETIGRTGFVKLDPAAGKLIADVGSVVFFALVGVLALWVVGVLVRNVSALRADSAQAAPETASRLLMNRRSFAVGAALLASFAGTLLAILSPSFGDGRNGLEYADGMFNSLSKGSAYYVAEETREAARQEGKQIDVALRAGDGEEARAWAKLYDAAGATAQVAGAEVRVRGDLGGIMRVVLLDCDAAYRNESDRITAKYGVEPRAATYAWYQSLKRMDEAFLKQERFEQSSAVRNLMYKALEPAYNYYGVEIRHVRDNVAPLALLLAFYLVYTIWYGAAIYYLCEAFGLTMGKPAVKSEV